MERIVAKAPIPAPTPGTHGGGFLGVLSSATPVVDELEVVSPKDEDPDAATVVDDATTVDSKRVEPTLLVDEVIVVEDG